MSGATRYTPEMIDEYFRKGYWTDETLCDFWDRCARDFPDKEAIVDSKTRLTWAEAKQWIDRLALGFLELGIKRDEMIALQLPPMVEAFLVRVACEKIGVLSLPVARTFRHKEMEYILNFAEPIGLVIPGEFAGFNYFAMLQEIRPNIPGLRHVFVVGDKVPHRGTRSLKEMLESPLERKYPLSYLDGRKYATTETSLVVHTTGTTGLPKLVEHAMCSRLWNMRAHIRHLGLTGDDIIGVFSPVAAGPNSAAYFGAPQLGAKVVIMERFDAEEALALIEKERITFGFLAPTMLIMMLNHPNFGRYDLSSLRLVFSAGAALTYDVGVEAEEKIGCIIVQGYGAMDADVNSVPSPKDSREVRLATVGKPAGATEIILVDDEGRKVPRREIGEVWGRGPCCAPGYYRDEAATWEAWKGGWFRMGDLGKWDEVGNLVLVGRKKDVIIRGGQNIYPAEVENILQTHPRVKEVAIVGMPDPLMGQRCCAYVVPQPGQEFSFVEMVSFLREKKFALHKLPERLELIERLPRVGDQQKVDKKVLEQDIIHKLKAEGGQNEIR